MNTLDSASAASPASREELLLALNELLEAERAGARVAMETGREIAAPDLLALVQDIHKDEVRWCGMLMRTITGMGGSPSSATGAFWGKAMAIADVGQRLVFLNRGQAWVVRKLQALMPRVIDLQVRAELATMLAAHHHNIALVDARALAGAPPPPDGKPG
jgi:nitronate monooxygenase